MGRGMALGRGGASARGFCSEVPGLGMTEEVDHKLFDLIVFQQEAVVSVQ